VRWARGDAPILLQVDASGRVTALETLGDMTLSVSVPNPAVRRDAQTIMEITVVPQGTFRIAGKVTEAESPSSAIRGARVEVTPGAFVTSTDLSGRYKLHGVPADAHRVVGAVATFGLDGFDTDSVVLGPIGYPSIAERLPNGEFLVVSGTATATSSAGGLSRHLNGVFTGWGLGFPTNPEYLGSCYSATHRLMLTPRHP
jgi:hypothetical protein